MPILKRHTGLHVPIAITDVVLLALIVAIGSVAVYLQFFYKPRVDAEYVKQVAAAAEDRLKANAPELRREIVSLGEDALPIVQAALVERARSDYHVYAQTLEHEGTEFFNNVERAFVAKVKSRYREYLQRHRQILEQEFPEHATRENVEQVLAAFEATFDDLVERYYLDQFRREAARTEELWASIPPAQPPAEDEPSLEEQLADTTRQWLLMALQTMPSSPPREVQTSIVKP